MFKNHVDPLQENLENIPKSFSSVRIKTTNRDIDSFSASDFELISCDAQKKISMKMAV